jgi:hypothetical protein
MWFIWRAYYQSINDFKFENGKSSSICAITHQDSVVGEYILLSNKPPEWLEKMLETEDSMYH